MKTPPNYRPKYSLSIYYLKQIMSKRELNSLITAYVEIKKKNWKDRINKK